MIENNILQVENLEELLLKNWTQFLDSSRFMAFCLQNIRDNQHTFTEADVDIGVSQSSAVNLQITLSRFQIKPNYFILWAEFKMPINHSKFAIGTSELTLSNTGELKHIQTLGNLYNI
jgi:hypothetical protein